MDEVVDAAMDRVVNDAAAEADDVATDADDVVAVVVDPDNTDDAAVDEVVEAGVAGNADEADDAAAKDAIMVLGRVVDEVHHWEAVIESLLFVESSGLTAERIAEILELDPGTVKTILNEMLLAAAQSRRGIILREVNGKYQFCTKPEYGVYIDRLFDIRQKQGLSQASYETLSIIAYHANVTRAAIEKIRGVNSDSSVIKLLEKNLIRETGRLRIPGRPMTYDVTDEFFRSFGFRSRKDLPDLQFENASSDTEQDDIVTEEPDSIFDIDHPAEEHDAGENIEADIMAEEPDIVTDADNPDDGHDVVENFSG